MFTKPKFPDWQNLTCIQISDEIYNLRQFLMTYKGDDFSIYESAIAEGEISLDDKCRKPIGIFLDDIPISIENTDVPPIKVMPITLPPDVIQNIKLPLDENPCYMVKMDCGDGMHLENVNGNCICVKDSTPIDVIKDVIKPLAAPISKDLKPYIYGGVVIVAILLVAKLLKLKQ